MRQRGRNLTVHPGVDLQVHWMRLGAERFECEHGLMPIHGELQSVLNGCNKFVVRLLAQHQDRGVETRSP